MTAAGAETVEFEAVGSDRKAVSGCDFFLKALNIAVFELHDLSTAGADEMVMVALVGHIVILSLGAEMSGLGQTGFAEKIERPVDGGEPQVRIFARQLVVQLFSGDVLLLEKRVKNQLTLPSKFELVLPKVFLQSPHFFRMFRHSDETSPPR